MVKMRGWRLIIMMAVVESGHDPSQKTVVFLDALASLKTMLDIN